MEALAEKIRSKLLLTSRFRVDCVERQARRHEEKPEKLARFSSILDFHKEVVLHEGKSIFQARVRADGVVVTGDRGQSGSDVKFLLVFRGTTGISGVLVVK